MSKKMFRLTKHFMFCLFLLNPLALVFSATSDAEIQALRNEVAELRELVLQLTKGQENINLAQANNEAKIEEITPKPRTDFDFPELKIKGFGHAQYDYVNPDTSATDSTNFTNGGLDLIITSQIASQLSFLNETVFEFGEGGENILDVERVLLKYEYADWLNVEIGRGHTNFGYWNKNFHHGTWLQTTTDRPLIYRFEDDGGILPVHFVGLRFTGNLGFDFGEFNYFASIANGRGKITDSVQLIEDLNVDKQLNIGFTVEPYAIEGLGFGANVLYDVIPEDSSTIGRENEIDEIIAGFHLFYTTAPYEFIAEYQYINHNETRSANSHHGGYMQFAHTWGKFKPYYRFDFLSIDPNDVYFAGLDGVESSLQHTIGFRYQWYPFAALKFEYRRLDANSVDSNSLTSQVTFAF